MTHQRIRKFNTAQMYPGKKMDNDLSMAVRAGNRVFLRGQTGFDLEGNMTGIGDPAKQAEATKIAFEIREDSIGDPKFNNMI